MITALKLSHLLIPLFLGVVYIYFIVLLVSYRNEMIESLLVRECGTDWGFRGTVVLVWIKVVLVAALSAQNVEVVS
jgi:hypothetical protein